MLTDQKLVVAVQTAGIVSLVSIQALGEGRPENRHQRAEADRVTKIGTDGFVTVIFAQLADFGTDFVESLLPADGFKALVGFFQRRGDTVRGGAHFLDAQALDAGKTFRGHVIFIRLDMGDPIVVDGYQQAALIFANAAKRCFGLGHCAALPGYCCWMCCFANCSISRSFSSSVIVLAIPFSSQKASR